MYLFNAQKEQYNTPVSIVSLKLKIYKLKIFRWNVDDLSSKPSTGYFFFGADIRKRKNQINLEVIVLRRIDEKYVVITGFMLFFIL